MGAIVFVVPTDLAFMFGGSADWLPVSRAATLAITGGIVAAIALVAVYGLDFSKWLHNAGSVLVMIGYAVLLTLPFWALGRGHISTYDAFPWRAPEASWYTLAIFGQMCVGALSGFEYVAILAGECHSAARTIGRSVAISAPIIAVMFILGTSSVLTFVGSRPINVIGPIPQTIRLALGTTGRAAVAAPFAIFMVMARNIAAASLIFTGLTRLPMTAGWDRLVPRWFAELHPRRRTPVNSIVFVALLVTALILLSMLGVREQEASQTLAEASVALYAIAYIGLFALPLVGRAQLRARLPMWVKAVSAAGLISSMVSLFIAVYPIVDVVSRGAFAAKICSVVAVSNGLGILIYRAGRRTTS
jgi:amino acid transporter